MPCKPPIAFVSIVGHAIFQTAGCSGPSTIERSNRLLPESSFKLSHFRKQAWVLDFLRQRFKLRRRTAPTQLLNIRKQRRVSLQNRELFEQQRQRTLLFIQDVRRKVFQRTVAIDQLR